VIKVMWGGPGDAEVFWESETTSPEQAAQEAFQSDTRHSQIARRMQGLRRYAVNRSLPRQPSFVDSSRVPRRIAELWWDTVQDVEDCFNSPSGLADLGDAAVRLPPRPINFPERMSGPNITFLNELPLPVKQPLGLDVHNGHYLGVGLMIKLYGFVTVDNGAAFDEWYVDEGAKLTAELPGLRAHVLEQLVPASIRIGNITRGEQPASDRVLDLWFMSVDDIDRDMASEAGRAFTAAVEARVVGVEWLAMRNQEIFFSYELEESLYQ
jgi:hypothetical protein